MFTISENEWVTEVVQTSDTEGYIIVALPEYNYKQGRFTLWASNNGNTIVKRVTFYDADCSVIDVDMPVRTINYLGGDLYLSFCSGVDTQLLIPSDAADWLSVLETKSPSCYSKILHFEKNLSSERWADITIKNDYFEQIITVNQKAISGIFVDASKDIIKADGVDFTSIKVYTNEGEDVTSQSLFYGDDNEIVNLTDGKFATNAEGVYTFKATYLTYISSLTHVYALNDIDDNQINDNQPNNTSFKHRSFVLRYTGTSCRYCVNMINRVRELEADKTIPNDAVLAVAHTYDSNDPAYINSSYLKANSYPYLTVDNSSSYSYLLDVSELRQLIADDVKDAADAGIAVNSTISGEYLKLSVGVKAAVAGMYGVTVWILKDGIYGTQSGATDSSYYYHDNCITTTLPYGNNPFVGAPLGTLSPKSIGKKTFAVKVNGSLDKYHLVVTVSKMIDNNWRIVNAINCPVTGITDFEYTK